jgi:hypothetical protein
MRKICATLIAVATALVGTEAFAQDHWSLNGGDIVRGDMIAGEFGWPDASFQWAHGVSPNLDVGIRASLLYGIEGTTFTAIGFGFKVPIRIQVVHSGKVSLLVHIDPGLKVYASEPLLGNHVAFGPEFPAGFQLGIHVIPDGMITFGANLNMWVDVTPPRGADPFFVLNPLFGPGFEYHVDHNLGIELTTGFGPAVRIGNGGSDTEFSFQLQAGILYRL